jgi:hypothetical protein
VADAALTALVSTILIFDLKTVTGVPPTVVDVKVVAVFTLAAVVNLAVVAVVVVVAFTAVPSLLTSPLWT